jgi:hypothetical protein
MSNVENQMQIKIVEKFKKLTHTKPSKGCYICILKDGCLGVEIEKMSYEDRIDFLDKSGLELDGWHESECTGNVVRG